MALALLPSPFLPHAWDNFPEDMASPIRSMNILANLSNVCDRMAVVNRDDDEDDDIVVASRLVRSSSKILFLNGAVK